MNAKLSDLWMVSNSLSLLRALLTLPAAWLLWEGHNVAAYAVGVGCYITDLLDGWLARRLNQVTETGKIIDPLADKIFVGVITTILVVQGRLPLWFVACILLRDVVILLAGLYITRRTQFVLPSNYPGKASVLSLIFTMTFVVLQLSPTLVWAGIWTSCALMAVSLALYTQRFVQTLRSLPSPPSPLSPPSV
jgi:CDP-diacylglycerol--glycerol-3-phosphate 3-phosphatidyltransferase